jgi:hypothetical protein
VESHSGKEASEERWMGEMGEGRERGEEERGERGGEGVFVRSDTAESACSSLQPSLLPTQTQKAVARVLGLR